MTFDEFYAGFAATDLADVFEALSALADRVGELETKEEAGE